MVDLRTYRGWPPHDQGARHRRRGADPPPVPCESRGRRDVRRRGAGRPGRPREGKDGATGRRAPGRDDAGPGRLGCRRAATGRRADEVDPDHLPDGACRVPRPREGTRARGYRLCDEALQSARARAARPRLARPARTRRARRRARGEAQPAARADGKRLAGAYVQRAACARPMPASVSAAPASWMRVSDSPSHAHATRIATTGSSIATIAVRVAPMRGSAATTSRKGTIEPRTTIHATRSHSGAWIELRCTSSDVLPSNLSDGNDHHGSTTAQKSDANAKPHAKREIGSRVRVPRSATRT